MKKEYNYWKVTTFLLLFTISIYCGTFGKMELIRFDAIRSIYALLAMSGILVIVQLPAWIDLLIERKQYKGEFSNER